MKKNLIIVALIFVVGILMYNNCGLREKLGVSEANVHAMNAKVDSIKSKEGELYLKTETLQYTVSQLKSYNKDLLDELKSLKIKPKNTDYVSTGEIYVYIHDTVTLKEENGVLKGEYNDPWTYAMFSVKDTLLSFEYNTQDTMHLILYKSREKFNIFHPFRKRPVHYNSVAHLTRPTGSVVVNSIKISNWND